MLRLDKRQMQAIRGLYEASPSYFSEYVAYLDASRDAARLAMENGEAAFNELEKGKCRILTSQINTLKSLIPQLGDQF